MLDFIENQRNSSIYKTKLFLFCINSILYTLHHEAFQNLQTKFISIINVLNHNIELHSSDISNILNKVLHKFYATLNLKEWTSVKNDKAKKESFEFCLKNKLSDTISLKSFVLGINIISLLTDRFKKQEINFETIALNEGCNFLALFSYEMTRVTENLNQNDRDLVLDFLNYIKNQIENKYHLILDFHFVIRHELYKYESILNENILNNAIEKFDDKCLFTLKIAKDSLINIDCLYSVLVILESINEPNLKNGLRELYWSVFEKLNYKDKIKIVYEIYTRNEITKNKDNNEVACLIDLNFNNDVILAINQLSSENYDDVQVKISVVG